MHASTIAVVDQDGISFSASPCQSAGVDAVIYRIHDGCLLFQQPDESFKSATGKAYRLATADL